ncbi:MAG: hypothetical protein H7039_14530 [Bryobacteraceae bacterium]|nr:hypothetical protein [Bryobacteraceae bacterium]
MESSPTAPPSLKGGLAWSLAGNVVNGASQWAVLSLIAKLTSTEILGQFALALAVATPIAMLAHLNLRSVFTTDVHRTNPFADYFAVRLWTGIGGLAITLMAGLLWAPFWPVGITIVLAGLYLGIENFQDLWYAAMQRRERLDLVAKSMILRAGLSLSAATALLLLFRNAPAAVGGVVIGRALTFVCFDLVYGKIATNAAHQPWQVFRAALPLGLTLLFISLTASIPRYAVERHLGTAELGIFAAVSSFVTVGSVMVNALGQSAITRLARYFLEDRARFRTLVLKLVAIVAALGMSGALLAYLAGDFFLTLLYRPGFASYQHLLVHMMLAGTVLYTASILGFAVTSTRQFREQLSLVIAVVVTSGMISLFAVPRIGGDGAVLAIAGAATVQICGNLFLLRKAL